MIHVIARSRELAHELMSKVDPANHNQALMELGSTLCTPKKPKCTECPIQQACLAYAEVREGGREELARRSGLCGVDEYP